MPKITFVSVKGNSYYSDGFLSVGMFLQDKKAILIDSGGDESAAKDIHAAAEALGAEVVAIITTHCHPDHCGGNSFLQKKYPAVLTYAAYNEKFFIEDPLQAPRCFCMGAVPFSGLQNKYLAPQRPSVITNVIAPYEDQIITISGVPMRIVTLPGHTQGSIGVITPDNVLYSGDALFGKETLLKHPILLYTDIATTFATFDKLEKYVVDACVLYHGGVMYELSGLITEHRENLKRIKESVVVIIQKESCSLDVLTQKIMQQYTIPSSMISFVLTQTALRAYVTLLEEEGIVKLVVNDGLLQAVYVKE